MLSCAPRRGEIAPNRAKSTRLQTTFRTKAGAMSDHPPVISASTQTAAKVRTLGQRVDAAIPTFRYRWQRREWTWGVDGRRYGRLLALGLQPMNAPAAMRAVTRLEVFIRDLQSLVDELRAFAAHRSAGHVFPSRKKVALTIRPPE